MTHAATRELQMPPQPPRSQSGSIPADATPPTDEPQRILDIASALNLLGGAVRLQLLRLLANGPHCVGDAAERLGIGLSLASHNLRKLEEAGLVVATRRERQRIYQLDGTMAAAGPDGLRLEIPLPPGWTLTLECPFRTPQWPAVQTDEASARSILARPIRPAQEPPPHSLKIQTED